MSIINQIVKEYIDARVEGKKVTHLRKEVKILLHLAEEIENDSEFGILCARFNEENIIDAVNKIATDVLSTENLNWGRVAVMFAFVGKISEKYRGKVQIKCITEDFARIVEDKSDWIHHSGGWDGFVKIFECKNSIKYCTQITVAAIMTALIYLIINK